MQTGLQCPHPAQCNNFIRNPDSGPTAQHLEKFQLLSEATRTCQLLHGLNSLLENRSKKVPPSNNSFLSLVPLIVISNRAAACCSYHLPTSCVFRKTGYQRACRAHAREALEKGLAEKPEDIHRFFVLLSLQHCSVVYRSETYVCPAVLGVDFFRFDTADATCVEKQASSPRKDYKVRRSLSI